MNSIQHSARTMNVGTIEPHWIAHDAIVERQTQTLRSLINSQEVHANTRTHQNTTLLMLSVKQRNATAFEALADRMRSRSTSTLSRQDIQGNTVLHYIAHCLPDDVVAADSSDPAWRDRITSFFHVYPLHLPWAITNRNQETALDMVERLGKTNLQALMNMALEVHPYDRYKHPDSSWCDDF